MANPEILTTKACLIQLWRNFYACIYSIFVVPLIKLVYHFLGRKEDIRTDSLPDSPSDEGTAIAGDGQISTTLYPPEESSEDKDSSDASDPVVTSKTNIKAAEQVSLDDTDLSIPVSVSEAEVEAEAGIGVTVPTTSAQNITEELLYLHNKLDELSDDVYKLTVVVLKGKDENGVDAVNDKEASSNAGVDLAQGGCKASDVKKDVTEQVAITPCQNTAGPDGNVAEDPPGEENATDEAGNAGTDIDDNIPPSTGRLLDTKDQNLISGDFTGTPNNGRPPESNDPQDDPEPQEMLCLDQYESSKTLTPVQQKQRGCITTDSYDPSDGPPALFEIEETPEPPDADDVLYPEESDPPPWDDSGPREMLYGVLNPNALSDIRLHYGDCGDDDLGSDVCFGDKQPPRDAWDLERHDEMADKGLVDSVMRHISKPPGQDLGMVEGDMEDQKPIPTEKEKDSSRSSDLDLAPQERPFPCNINNSDVVNLTQDTDCG